MVTYGGDEVSALVLDVGSSSTRAGYAGEDTPKAVFSTTYGVSGNASSQKYHIGDTETSVWKSDMEMRNPMDAEGLVTDWDILEKIWAYALKTRLQVDPVEHPLLVTEPAWNTSANKEKMAELAFEKFNVPALYAAKSPVMSAFASGKPTALILDVGGSTTSVVPVYEGLVLKKRRFRRPVINYLTRSHHKARPRRRLHLRTAQTTPSSKRRRSHSTLSHFKQAGGRGWTTSQLYKEGKTRYEII